ncbi:hypothetical protein KUTeg_024344 [Tegillarca granosa]|uniref:Fatty acyl-CoA reductase n=1 Tax=Tegillarca granosa TaxID=220873 RepID=A0ABQ9DX27_TEGGR|nr:hypothetical protein KUTeg_024344 [Tegillarca granosa]
MLYMYFISGGAYLPLDVSYPMVLLESILQDSKPIAILTSEDLVTNLENLEVVRVLAKAKPQAMRLLLRLNPHLLNFFQSQTHSFAVSVKANPTADVLSSRKFCPVGPLLPGVKVVILGPDNKPQPVGASGEVIIQNTYRHSLLATELLVQLRDKYNVGLTVQDLFTYPTIASLSRLLDAKLNKSQNGKAAAVIPTFDLMTEVDRHDQGNVKIDMQLRAFWRIINVGNQNRFKKGRVLLTGATGFLGAFILQELLLKTKTLVYCVVRELPDLEPMERIEKTLHQYGILATSNTPTEQQTCIRQMLKKRVHAVKGDLDLYLPYVFLGNVALVNMGMNEDDFTYLCTDIDFIIHAAATVNLVYPFAALQGPNVMGTANVVMFACTGKVKPIHYIRWIFEWMNAHGYPVKIVPFEEWKNRYVTMLSFCRKRKCY